MHSNIEVDRVDGRSRLTACRSITPLKILSPRSAGDYATAILSSYGGGMVEGDQIQLTLRCGVGATLYLGTQAYTKVYKNPRGFVSQQLINGRVEENACVVTLPDPIVPYADSIFRQEQKWDLDAGALLILLDGYTSGRQARGEYFAYNHYVSNIDVKCNGKLVLAEHFSSQPKQLPPSQSGVMGHFLVTANIFIVGDPGNNRFNAVTTLLAEQLTALMHTSMSKEQAEPSMQFSFAQAKPGVFVVRVLGSSASAVEPVHKVLARAVALPEILGYDPLSRKY